MIQNNFTPRLKWMLFLFKMKSWMNFARCCVLIYSYYGLIIDPTTYFKIYLLHTNSDSEVWSTYPLVNDTNANGFKQRICSNSDLDSYRVKIYCYTYFSLETKVRLKRNSIILKYKFILYTYCTWPEVFSNESIPFQPFLIGF